MSQCEDREREVSLNQPSCSILAFRRLGEAHPHWREQSALFSLLTQILISLRNALRITLEQLSGHPSGTVKLTAVIRNSVRLTPILSLWSPILVIIPAMPCPLSRYKP